MKNLFKQFVREESGQDLIEYVLLASFIAAGVVAGATFLGTQLNAWYSGVGTWAGTPEGQVHVSGSAASSGDWVSDDATPKQEKAMSHLVGRFIREDSGQDLIEYVLLASFISAGVVAGATFLGTNLNAWYSAIGTWASTNSGKFT